MKATNKISHVVEPHAVSPYRGIHGFRASPSKGQNLRNFCSFQPQEWTGHTRPNRRWVSTAVLRTQIGRAIAKWESLRFCQKCKLVPLDPNTVQQGPERCLGHGCTTAADERHEATRTLRTDSATAPRFEDRTEFSLITEKTLEGIFQQRT